MTQVVSSQSKYPPKTKQQKQNSKSHEIFNQKRIFRMSRLLTDLKLKQEKYVLLLIPPYIPPSHIIHLLTIPKVFFVTHLHLISRQQKRHVLSTWTVMDSTHPPNKQSIKSRISKDLARNRRIIFLSTI